MFLLHIFLYDYQLFAGCILFGLQGTVLIRSCSLVDSIPAVNNLENHTDTTKIRLTCGLLIGMYFYLRNMYKGK
jgi:hypothetical protein